MLDPVPSPVAASPFARPAAPAVPLDDDRFSIERIATGYAAADDDLDGDGRISLATEARRLIAADPAGRPWLPLRVSDIRPLTFSADWLGNRDGAATRTEYRDALEQFDRGGSGAVAGDGYLDGIELAAFDASGLVPTVHRIVLRTDPGVRPPG